MLIRFLTALFVLAFSLPAAAQGVADTDITHGPAAVPLQNEAVLKLPQGMIFVNKRGAAQVLQRMGNAHNENLVGLIVPEDQKSWLTIIRYEDSGYVNDEDGKNIDADALLKGIREGTIADNKERIAQGHHPIEVVGWIEPPHYDPARHHLIWSAEVRDISQDGQQHENSVNYNTHALGRGGYFSLNLIAKRSEIDQYKPVAATLLTALDFNDGKKYTDFNAKTDKVAEYGLLALIGGVALKKLGLIALAAAFMAKNVKLVMLSAAGVVTVIKKKLGRDKGPQA